MAGSHAKSPQAGGLTIPAMDARHKTALDGIISLLKKKNSFLEEFLRLTAGQKQALAEKDMDRFNKLLEAKQAVIEQVDMLDLQLDYRKSQASINGRPGGKTPSPGTVQVLELERDIGRTLQQIKLLDREVHELMKKNLAETVKHINELQVARRTETAYRENARPAQSFFVNKKR